MSPAKDLGTRHTCYSCGTKFYDLKKPAPICPKCGADQRESPALKEPPKAARKPAVAPAPAPRRAIDEEPEAEEEPLDGDEDEESFDDDAEDAVDDDADEDDI